MRQLSFTLAGEPFTMTELSVRKNRAWREQLSAPLMQILEAIKGAEDIEITSTADLPPLLNRFKSLILSNLDLVPELAAAYIAQAPTMAERGVDWILDNATEEELLTAMIEICKVAFPLDFFRQQFASLLKNGLLPPQILMSLRAANGASGLTTSTTSNAHS